VQLLIVIHHPHTPLRPASEIAQDVAAVYDRVMGSTSRRHLHELEHTLVLLLDWPAVTLGWPAWEGEAQGDGLLATAGLPLIYAPVGEPGEVLRPDRVKRLMSSDQHASDLGWCGGAFAAALVKGDVVHLATNYLGEVPLYRAGAGGVTVWSNKAAAAAMLAGLPLTLDPEAARQLILLAHPLAERTLIAGVALEDSATRITLDARGVRRKRYLDLPRAMFDHRQPREQIVKQVVRAYEPLITLLRESGADVRLHLSGGMDSRAVAAICTRYGYRVPAVTHSTPNDEVASATRLARRLKLHYTTIPGGEGRSGGDLFEHLDAMLWQSDGQSSLKYLAGRYDLEMVRQMRYLPLEGLGGECGRGYYFAHEEDLQQLRAGALNPFEAKTLGKRLALWPRADDAAALQRELAGIIDAGRAGGVDTVSATTWFYVNQRVRRWGVARRNTGWQWIIDPLLLPCWTYLAMSADPMDQVEDRLIAATTDHAQPLLRGVPTSRQLAAAARRRRVAGNRITRTVLAWWDRRQPPPPPHVQTRTLQAVSQRLQGEIEQAAGALAPVLSPADAAGWLAATPWKYEQTELFWHAATVAAWHNRIARTTTPIRAAAASLSLPGRGLG
jgi:hypothetical protein